MARMREQVPAYIVQFIVSDREYERLLTRLGNKISAKLPPAERVSRSAHHHQGTFPHKFVRNHTRLFLKVYLALAGVNVVGKLAARLRGAQDESRAGIPAARIAGALVSISALYRVCYGLLDRLSQSKEGDKKKKCNLMTPVISGLIAGAGFGIYPKNAARGYVGLIVASKAIEFVYNYLDDEGYMEFKPRLLGSWALFPFSLGQLFYTFIFHPDCCPSTVSNILFRLSDGYIPEAPASFNATDPWPSPEEIVSSIAEISRQKYPPFTSPILFPETFTIPTGLEQIEPVISMAHPAITTLTGAVMHPYQRSEFRTYLELILRKFGSVSKYVFAAYAITGLMKSKATGIGKASSLVSSFGYSIRTTIFIVMTAASAWSGVGVFQKIFGRNVLPVQRYRLMGFMAGLWAFVDQVNGRARYTYAARLAVLSYWNTLVKQRKIKPLPYGDVVLFAVSFAVLMGLLDHAPGSISGPKLRKALTWIRSDSATDPCEEGETKEKEL